MLEQTNELKARMQKAIEKGRAVVDELNTLYGYSSMEFAEGRRVWLEMKQVLEQSFQ